MDLEEIKKQVMIIKNIKDIENIERILSYGDLGTKIKEVSDAIIEL